MGNAGQPHSLHNNEFSSPPIVVGAGITGLLTCLELLEKGQRPALLIDAERFGAGDTSHAHCVIHGGYSYMRRPRVVAELSRAFKVWQQLISDFELPHETGVAYYFIRESDKDTFERRLKKLPPNTLLTPEEYSVGSSSRTYISPDTIAGGAVRTNEIVVNPSAVINILADYVDKQTVSHGRFYWSQSHGVQDLRPSASLVFNRRSSSCDLPRVPTSVLVLEGNLPELHGVFQNVGLPDDPRSFYGVNITSHPNGDAVTWIITSNWIIEGASDSLVSWLGQAFPNIAFDSVIRRSFECEYTNIARMDVGVKSDQYPQLCNRFVKIAGKVLRGYSPRFTLAPLVAQRACELLGLLPAQQLCSLGTLRQRIEKLSLQPLRPAENKWSEPLGLK